MRCPWEDDVVVAQPVYHCSPTIGWSQNLLIGVHISHHQAPIAPATCWDCGHLFPARPQKGLTSTPPLPVTKRWLLACILTLLWGRFPAWHCKTRWWETVFETHGWHEQVANNFNIYNVKMPLAQFGNLSSCNGASPTPSHLPSLTNSQSHPWLLQ